MVTYNSRKRILVPLLHDYYLFDYFRYLVPQLLNDGFQVTIITLDQRIKAKYQLKHPEFTVVQGSKLLGILLAHANKVLFRVMLWIYARIWGWRLRRKYDVVILALYNSVLRYVLARTLPALMCHTTTDLIDLELTLEKERWEKQKHNTYERVMHKLLVGFDFFTSGRLLPRINGQITRYHPAHLIIDRLMGWRAPNYLGGSIPGLFITVPGSQIKATYRLMGIDESRLFVVGNPGYDHLFRLKEQFGQTDKLQFCNTEGIATDKTVFSFFLSPSSFTSIQLKEVVEVISCIRKKISQSFFVLKFHPKTDPIYPQQFREALSACDDDLLFLTDFAGDEYNAKLILVSNFIVQKQSTVGFIAMMYGKPIISYNIYTTNYEDNMYKIFDASAHAESLAELDKILDKIDSDSKFWLNLKERQRHACARFCLATDSASKNISQIIRDYL